MITITFAPAKTEKRALAFLLGRFSGHWRSSGILYRDNLVKIVVDVLDSNTNRNG